MVSYYLHEAPVVARGCLNYPGSVTEVAVLPTEVIIMRYSVLMCGIRSATLQPSMTLLPKMSR